MKYYNCLTGLLLLGHLWVDAQESQLISSTWSTEDDAFDGHGDPWVNYNYDLGRDDTASSSVANVNSDTVELASASSISENSLTYSMIVITGEWPSYRLSAKVSRNKAIESVWFELRKEGSPSYSPSGAYIAVQESGSDADLYHARIIGIEGGERYICRVKVLVASPPGQWRSQGRESSYSYSSEYGFVVTERDSVLSAPVDDRIFSPTTATSTSRYLQPNNKVKVARIRFSDVVTQMTTHYPEFSTRAVDLNRTSVTSARLLYGPRGKNIFNNTVNLKKQAGRVWASKMNNLVPGKYSGKLRATSKFGVKTSGVFNFELIDTSGAPSAAPSTSSPSSGLSGSPTGSPSSPPSIKPSIFLAPTTGIKYGLQDNCKTIDSSRFNICLDLTSQSGNYEKWMDAFAAARDRWEQVITNGNYAPMDLRLSGLKVPRGASEPPTMVDDIYVAGTVTQVDGRGGVIGMAGPRVIREYTSPEGNLYYRPRAGIIKFDVDDVFQFSDSVWQSVIAHELGHVLGVGTMLRWNNLTYVQDQFWSDWYLGPNAQAEWQKLCPGGRLPVETDGGMGTAGAHWDESCLKGELMTGYNSPNAMQLSAITIASLMDVGYSVNMSAADPFTRADLGKCGAYCPDRPDSKRNLRESSRLERHGIKISEEGHQQILRAAATEIRRNRLATPQHLRDDVKHIAENYLTVFIIDTDGQIKEESVTYNDVKDYVIV